MATFSHCCLGTFWHSCLGTFRHSCLGSLRHCCLGTLEHSCLGTVLATCLHSWRNKNLPLEILYYCIIPVGVRSDIPVLAHCCIAVWERSGTVVLEHFLKVYHLVKESEEESKSITCTPVLAHCCRPGEECSDKPAPELSLGPEGGRW